MRVIIQRVKKASVSVKGIIKGQISSGVLIFLGIISDDNNEDIIWLSNKIANLRIFDDKSGVMNISLKDYDGEALVISQFTLYAQTKKGNRPSYIKAAPPNTAYPIYNQFIEQLQIHLKNPVQKGVFGEHMEVNLLNDGPVTIIIDTKNRE